MTYVVTLVDEFGCEATDQVNIKLVKRPIVFVPNAFSPNGDGYNQRFLPVISNVSMSDYEFMVFDRWGLLIFSSDRVGEGWDGTYQGRMVQQDVYVWKLRCSSGDGNSYTDLGRVLLVR